MAKINHTYEISSEFKENYKFRIKILLSTGEKKIIVGKLLDTFIEDNIDARKDKDYLDKLIEKVVEKHLEDILELAPNNTIGNTKWWFKEAKRELENEKKENN